jgi:phage replication-related protein YjqB (UPF0714/DUF867 family)
VTSGQFAELLGHPGVEEQVELRSTFGFLAFHGGSLEEGTDQIAARAAVEAGASLYAVRQPPELRWHLPSRLVRPEESAALASFVAHVDAAVAIHGYGRAGRWTTVLVGGRNRPLAGHVAGHLRAALPGYEVVDDLGDTPAELRGVHPDNPVNRCTHPSGGVQLELPPRVRGMGPFWSDHPAGEPVPHAEALVDGLAASARAWTTG